MQVALIIPLGEMPTQLPSLPGMPGGPPGHAGQPLPPAHGRPDQGLPGGPPGHADNTLPGGGHNRPSNPIVLPPGQPWPPGVNPPIVPPDPPLNSIWPPLTPGTATKKALVLVYISGYGEKHIVVDLPEPK